MTKLSQAEAAFERDIPAQHRDDIMTMIAEASQGWSTHDSVTILDRDRIDAINVRAHGIVSFQGQEYRFIVEDGNWNGTVLEDWEGDKEFKPVPRTEWALQPRRDLISHAILLNRGPFLIQKWDAFLSHPEVAEIPSKYAYDRMMAPGVVIETYWRERAAKFQMELVSQETAAETRRRLQEAA